MKQTSRCFFYVSEEFKPESMNVLVGKKTLCSSAYFHSSIPSISFAWPLNEW